MTIQHYTAQQIKGLSQLIEYRKLFSLIEGSQSDTAHAKKSPDAKEVIEKFADTFCQNDFADADYVKFQYAWNNFETMEAWLSQVDIPTTLQCFTYIIWTDKIVDNFFIDRIKDKTIDNLLSRLATLLNEKEIKSLSVSMQSF